MNDSLQPPSVDANKRRCTVTVTARAWHGSKAAAQALGCGSISELLEKLGHGELAVVVADEVGPPLTDKPGEMDGQGMSSVAWPAELRSQPPAPSAAMPSAPPVATTVPTSAAPRRSRWSLPKLLLTASCATLILLPILYVLDLTLSDKKQATINLENAVTLTTGDTVAGYAVTDHMRIRPVHPVTGATNVPHNGVDVGTPSGTPVYAVGVTGDQVTVECWWNEGGGGWVADQTTESYPEFVFQSLHLLENECRSGQFTSGDVIALSGNSGMGSGEHYDFRVKLNGTYIDPPKQLLEAALTGKTLALDGTLAQF